MSTNQAVGAGVIGGMAVTMLVACLAVWILLIIARWKIFTKAGEAGWKSIIPVYSDYVQWRIGWKKTHLFWVMIVLIVLGYILLSVGGYSFASTAANTAATMNMPLVGIGTIALLAGAILDLVSVFKLFKSFGWGVGMFILYILFPPIILMVLGFGSSEWSGAVD